MSKPEIKIIPTSQRGLSILEIRCDGDGNFTPTVSQQVPTHIAHWIKESCDANTE